MRNFTIFLVLLLCLFASKMLAQDPSPKGEQTKQSFEEQAKNIASNIENITNEEKSALKKEVDAVNDQLANGTITKEEAERKKSALAQVRAINIETRVAKEQEKLEILVQKKVDGQITELDTIKKPNKIILKWEKETKIMLIRQKMKKEPQHNLSSLLEQIIW